MKRHKSYVSAAEYKTLLPAKQNVKCGAVEPAELIISNVEMRVAEKSFWQKRGFSTPPGWVLGFKRAEAM